MSVWSNVSNLGATLLTTIGALPNSYRELLPYGGDPRLDNSSGNITVTRSVPGVTQVPSLATTPFVGNISGNHTGSSNISHNATEGDHHEGTESGHNPHVILFLMVSFATGVLVRGILKRITVCKIPYTVVLLVLGALFGLISARVPSLQVYTVLGRENPHIILHTFLPILIFESAFAMESHTFLKSSMSILLLAVPGMMISALLTAVVATYMFNYYWDFKEGLLFGAVTAATDPVAVVSLLRDVGAPKPLSMLIEGESLMNDGSAIVVFIIMLDICKGTGEVAFGPILGQFCQIAIGGPLFGVACGYFFVFWISRIFNDAVAEITLTIVAAYFTFYVGEAILEVSGVMAVVCLGVVINSKKTAISPEVESSLHMFWEMLAYLANTVIFILVGIVITEQATVVFTQKDLLDILVLYVAANFIRAVMVAICFPLLCRLGYGLSWQSSLVIIWGGLRGAVGLALALIIYQDPQLGASRTIIVNVTDHYGHIRHVEKVVGEKFLIHMASLVFFTLIINGTTTAPLLRVLGMSEISTAAKMNMTHAIQQLRESRNKAISMLKMDRFLADANWEIVEKYTFIVNPYHTKDTDEKVLLLDEFLYPSMRYSSCPECNSKVFNDPSPKEQFEMANDARTRYLKTEKGEDEEEEHSEDGAETTVDSETGEVMVKMPARPAVTAEDPPNDALLESDGPHGGNVVSDTDWTQDSDSYNSADDEPTYEELDDARRRYLQVERISYWRQFEHGMISAEAVRTLVSSTEVAADMEGAFLSIEELRKSWEVRGVFAWIRGRLESIAKTTALDEDEIELPKAKFRQTIYHKVVNTTWFEVLVYTVILLNMLLMILEYTTWYGDSARTRHDATTSAPPTNASTPLPLVNATGAPVNGSVAPSGRAAAAAHDSDDSPGLRRLELIRFSVNVSFFVFYVAEAVLKILGVGFRNYWRSHWNKLDLAVVLLSVGDIVFEVCDLAIKESVDEKYKILSPAILRNIRFLRLFRLTRVLRLIKPAIPRMLNFVNRQINHRLSLGYDIGKGYVVGEEEVAKYLTHMVDHRQILESLKRLSDESRLMVIRDLGMLQREHPGIAIAVKTRQAVRTVLNNVRETITDLKEGGLLDEAEHERLEHIIDDRVKLLMAAPSYLPPLPPTELLKNIHWVSMDLQLVDDIESKAELVNLDFGDSVWGQGDKPDGIYIIVSGMLRVECRELATLAEEVSETGVVPNSEILAPPRDVTVLRDYVGAGNVVGEVGLLTGRARDASVDCETSIQAYHLSSQVMADLMEKYSSGPENLDYMIWRSIGLKIAVNVLMDQSQYQSWTQQKIKIYVERAFLPKLDYKKTFTAVDMLEDVVLIQGRILNPHTREIFVAPAYIPRTVHQLVFPSDAKSSQVLAKILAIPREEMSQSDIWEMTGYSKDEIALKAISSSNCGRHGTSSIIAASRLSIAKVSRADVLKSQVQSLPKVTG